MRGAEPLALIAAAALAADTDTGGAVLAHVDAIELMPVGAWSYDDLGASVAGRLDLEVPPARRRVASDRGRDPAARARRCRGADRVR